MKKLVFVLASTLLLTLFALPAAIHADSTLPDDRFALKGLKQAHAIFDVRLAELDKLLFNLKLVKETWEGISSQKVKPTMIVSLRGPAVKLFTKEQAVPELKELLNDLKQKGIRIEICSVATRVFKVDNAQLLPDLLLVGNVLTSQIAWQNKGYALITLN
ncbi:DsrE family protein [Trichlorobacter lovleyi]|uniref:DsrE family protein n=1 Tax=Trichlorobacter lovleyi TaxID=313985 RepID=UPI002240B55B|nr:DsrE family protein [Trichlorobacter lovleyi]QOX79987.1 DsrE family protein [Trichlorobacter lovleyi]